MMLPTFVILPYACSEFMGGLGKVKRFPTMAELIVIEAGRHERNYWQDIWRYRELFRVLAWRDLAVRYKQTVIGVAWALIRPVLMMVIFTVVFGRIDKLP